LGGSNKTQGTFNPFTCTRTQHTHTRVHTRPHSRVRTHAPAHMRPHTRVCTYVLAHTYAPAHTHTRTHTRAYAPTNTPAHTHTPAHARISSHWGIKPASVTSLYGTLCRGVQLLCPSSLLYRVCCNIHTEKMPTCPRYRILLFISAHLSILVHIACTRWQRNLATVVEGHHVDVSVQLYTC